MKRVQRGKRRTILWPCLIAVLLMAGIAAGTYFHTDEEEPRQVFRDVVPTTELTERWEPPESTAQVEQPYSTTLAPSAPPKTTKPTTTARTTTTKKVVKRLIDAPYLAQGTKYPNGCESVTAVMAMRYAGISISVDTFIDRYLDQGKAPYLDASGVLRGADPNSVYLGDPRSTAGWGCYAPVVSKAIRKAVDGDKYEVLTLSGVSLSTLSRQYLDKDVPVILWATSGMAPAYTYKSWIVDGSGKTVTWKSPMHCLLLVGYDDSYYYFNDPQQGKQCRYSKSAVDAAYRALGRQAVVVRKK